ncbi:MAG: hypothetical protein CM1200mP20_05700 [Pseudomonadota bacterium]|nr:MAG: hypothetical protein CM1200mP20_05700 [Pseudomonadota bacterium]
MSAARWGPTYLPGPCGGRPDRNRHPGPWKSLAKGPIQLDCINDRMDELLKGHPYVKSAIDMACWDIPGQDRPLPLYTLLGGKQQDKVKLYKVVTRTDPDAMAARIAEYRAEGYRNYQVKVGADPLTDISRIQKVATCMEPGEVLNADANTRLETTRCPGGGRRHQGTAA